MHDATSVLDFVSGIHTHSALNYAAARWTQGNSLTLNKHLCYDVNDFYFFYF